MSTNYDRISLGLLISLAIAVGALFYLRFTDEPRIEYRTETRYAPSGRNSGTSDFGTFQEREDLQRLKGRIACLADHDSHKYAPGLSVPC